MGTAVENKPKKSEEADTGKEPKQTGKPKKPKKPKRGTMAAKADRYDLYQRSVQEPEADIEFFDDVFEEHYGRKAKTLLEDFCGTAYLACGWVQARPDTEAWGVDLDPVPLAWGDKHNISKLSEEERGRLHVVQGDVFETHSPKVDLIAAQNFSYCLFKERERLREYFKLCRERLNDEGLLVLDIFGGSESVMKGKEPTKHNEFTYIWHQKRFDAITNEILCYIHFRFPDGSKLKRAFEYDWRLWSIQELREVLLEAGFARAEAYWEEADDEGGGTGEFYQRDSAENEEAWIAYVVGLPH